MVCRPSQDKKKRRTLQNGKTRMLFSAFSLFLAFASSTPLNHVKGIFMVMVMRIHYLICAVYRKCIDKCYRRYLDTDSKLFPSLKSSPRDKVNTNLIEDMTRIWNGGWCRLLKLSKHLELAGLLIKLERSWSQAMTTFPLELCLESCHLRGKETWIFANFIHLSKYFDALNTSNTVATNSGRNCLSAKCGRDNMRSCCRDNFEYL